MPTVFAIYYQIARDMWGLVAEKATLDEALATALSFAERSPMAFFGVQERERQPAKRPWWSILMGILMGDEPENAPLPRTTTEEPRFVIAGLERCRPDRRNTPVVLPSDRFHEITQRSPEAV